MTPAPTLYQYVLRIAQREEQTIPQKLYELFQIFDRIYQDAVKTEQITFTTLFARVGYVGLKYHFSNDDLLIVHTFRKQASRYLDTSISAKPKERDLQIAVAAMSVSIARIYTATIPDEVLALYPKDLAKKIRPAHITGEFAMLQVLAVADHPEKDCLEVILDDAIGTTRFVLYNLPDRNQNFMPTIDVIRKVTGLPVLLNLIEVGIDKDDRLLPKALIVEPDHLFDISTISECFQQDATEPFNYLIRKFVTSPPTLAIHLGNIANHFLDRLITDPEAPNFSELFFEAFKANSLQFSLLTDGDIKELKQKAQIHYATIRSMIGGKFQSQGINPAQCLVEPSFFSAKYGLQGRLDLFYRTPEQAAIIELKSGAPFHPNAYGLSRTHFTQTLLYGLLISSVLEQNRNTREEAALLPPIAKYILYSRETENPLRFAPDMPSEQMEALQVRNQLLAIEYLLTRIIPGQVQVPVLERMAQGQIKAKGFTLEGFLSFQKHYTALSGLERKYFNAFTGFIAREQWSSRAGDAEADRRGGIASLWKKTYAEKELQYAILGHLHLHENRADQEDRLVTFRRTEQTNAMANFREGDIVMLYPAQSTSENVLQHQIIKGTLTKLKGDMVEVRLRHRQFNSAIFDAATPWQIEADHMEYGFTSQYQNLFRWASSPLARRQLLLGATPPTQGFITAEELPKPLGMLDAQFQIFKEIICAQDYYLLWGPPGTGKTSVMLRNLAAWWLHNTDERVLFLAYTNRAVDEICEALDTLATERGQDVYFRIGSEASTSAQFKSKLLDARIKTATTRKEIKEIISSYRIVAGTVASLQSQEALFQLSNFDRIVIDEASQLLEPQIIGLLSRFPKALLIGDHKQLPAVCTQPAHQSLVDDPQLAALGLTDMRNSYFERMYLHCMQKGWTWAVGQLRYQGRMHEDIMQFPARYFYGDALEIIPESEDQKMRIAFGKYDIPTPLTDRLLEQRVLFIPTPAQQNGSLWQKTNTIEAERILELYVFFRHVYATEGWHWNEHTFGVITPWRAQIAAIKSVFDRAGLNDEPITIDTVERYQGGARDIIVISLCTHSAQQLESLLSQGAEGVDRKLNVALTRARKHLIVLGVPEILQENAHYDAFMRQYGRE